MNALRRGACPTVSEPMPTGDGLLVRLVPISTIGLGQLAGLCQAARACGNGIIEVTTRGNIQVRGLSEASARAFARSVDMLGIDGPGSVPIMIDPLAGLTPHEISDASALAVRLRAALADSPFADHLGPKVSVVIDGGTNLHLDRIAADIRLRADPQSADPRYHVAVGGDARDAISIGTVADQDAVALVLRLLGVIASRGRAARAHQIVRADGAALFRAAAAGLVTTTFGQESRVAAEPIGQHPLRDGSIAIGFGFAFGHATADVLEQFVAAAEHARASGIRTAPQHALLVIGVEPALAPALVAAAQRLGLVTKPDDPRLHIAACAGKPLCASGRIATRALAPMIAAAAGTLLDGTMVVHLSGCSKGCAHAGAAALTIVGDGQACRVVVNGSTSDVSVADVDCDDLPSRLARLAHELAVLAPPGERAATALSRLGIDRITALLQEPHHG